MSKTADTKAPWIENEEDLPTVQDVQAVDTSTVEPASNTEMMVVEPDLPTSGRVYSEVLDFRPDEIRFPRLRLASGLTKEVANQEARMGQWLLTGHDPQNEVEIVIIGVTRFRLYALKEEQEILCRSDDGIHGIGNPGGLCADCPMAQWGERNPKTGRGTQPPCSNGFSYQVYSLTHDQPAILDFRRSQLEAANHLNTALYMRGARSAVFILKHEMRNAPVGGGKYPVPIVSQRPLSPSELERVNNIFPRD